MIESLTETQMSQLVANVKMEKVFPVPSEGEFEIDMSVLTPKQLLQFFILVRNVSAVSGIKDELLSEKGKEKAKRGRPPSSSSSSSSYPKRNVFAGGEGLGEED
jgi:hypothetical protein